MLRILPLLLLPTALIAQDVPAQPLLAQVNRLVQALETAGDPLPAAVTEAIKKLTPDQASVAEVRKVLDPLCLLHVVIDKEGSLKLEPLQKQPELVEQGWRTWLVKVTNAAESTGTLTYESPNARPVPHSTQDQVAGRWMDLAPLHSQPLLPKLSGLELEYRVLQVYCRDAGERTGMLTVKLGAQNAGCSRCAMSMASRAWVASRFATAGVGCIRRWPSGSRLTSSSTRRSTAKVARASAFPPASTPSSVREAPSRSLSRKS